MNCFSLASTKNKRNHHKEVTKTFKNDTTDIRPVVQCTFEEAVQQFESQCQSLSNFYCQCCQMTGISIKPSQRNNGICTVCQASKTSQEKKRKIYQFGMI